jgi:hypothetical protein
VRSLCRWIRWTAVVGLAMALLAALLLAAQEAVSSQAALAEAADRAASLGRLSYEADKGVQRTYLPLIPDRWACFVDEFEGEALDESRWTVITGTVAVHEGALWLADAEVQSREVFTYGVLQATIASSDWKTQDAFTDASFGFERWEGACHSGVLLKGSGHLAVLQNSNCPAIVEEYLPLAGWDDAIEVASTFYLTLAWSPGGVTLHVSDGAGYDVQVTSTLAPTVPLTLRFNTYWAEPHPPETYTIDDLRVCPNPH